MDFSFTEEQLVNKQKISDFCRKELASSAAELDGATGENAKEMLGKRIEALGREGILGLGFPEVAGGSGADLMPFVILMQELGDACPSTGLAVMSSVGLCARALFEWGDEAAQKACLADLLSGKILGAYASLEPEAGLDSWDLKTVATQAGDNVVLNGQKNMVLNAPMAGASVVSAADSNGQEGLFLVAPGAAGIELSAAQDKMGCRGAPTADLTLTDCHAARLASGDGEKAVALLRAYEHLYLAALSAGMINAAMISSGIYARDHKAGEKPLARHQEISFKLADALVFLDTAQVLIHRCVWLLNENSSEMPVLASCAKTFASESAVKAAGWALQIMGQEGYRRGSRAERLYRDAKLVEILGDPTERHRMFIADQVLAAY